jgi:hypothetical protein
VHNRTTAHNVVSKHDKWKMRLHGELGPVAKQKLGLKQTGERHGSTGETCSHNHKTRV